MRRIITYMLLLLLIVACDSKETVLQYTVKGDSEFEKSSILIFGLDGRFQDVDSIRTDGKGHFSYTMECDTVIPMILMMPDGNRITLFAEPNTKAEIAYDATTGAYSIGYCGALQMLHDSISLAIDSCKSQKEKAKKIESFIKEHPVSEVNIELLRRYIIEIPEPDYSQIKNFISKLGGILQDNEYLALTKKNIDEKSGNIAHKQFPSFTYTTADSCKEITHNTFNKKHLLVTFWATWNDDSRKQLKHLQRIDSIVDSENFDILNIALDYDTTEWKRVVENDSITGYNVCDEDAWSGEIAGKFKIKTLPYSLLLNPYQRIIKLDVDLEKDAAVIDSIVAKHEKSQKDREKREKEKEEKKKKANKPIKTKSKKAPTYTPPANRNIQKCL